MSGSVGIFVRCPGDFSGADGPLSSWPDIEEDEIGGVQDGFELVLVHSRHLGRLDAGQGQGAEQKHGAGDA